MESSSERIPGQLRLEEITVELLRETYQRIKLNPGMFNCEKLSQCCPLEALALDRLGSIERWMEVIYHEDPQIQMHQTNHFYGGWDVGRIDSEWSQHGAQLAVEFGYRKNSA